MRADRLLKMMFILQSRGRQTARSLAEELEVSVRTVYRDVTALNTAGVPVYTEKGPGGGILLIEEYRTSLTGLSPGEVQALFMLNIPAAAASLGMSGEVKAAMLKLSAALPGYLQKAETGVRQRVMIDADWQRGASDRSPGFLRELYQAVWNDHKVRIEVEYIFGYRARHLVEPYSLIALRREWHLVCRVGDRYKVFSLEDIRSLEVTNEKFFRDAGFDLSAFWKSWNAHQDGYEYMVWLSTNEKGLAHLQQADTCSVLGIDPDPSREGWFLVSARFFSFGEARRTVMDLGSAALVLEPEALRRTIEDLASQILDLYQK
jgi:predicted DNA-binding transcriptional regulator YafY